MSDKNKKEYKMKKVMVATAILAIGVLFAACAEPAAIQVKTPAVANHTVTFWSAQPDEMQLLMGSNDNGNAPAVTTPPESSGQWSRIADEMLLLERAPEILNGPQPSFSLTDAQK